MSTASSTGTKKKKKAKPPSQPITKQPTTSTQSNPQSNPKTNHTPANVSANKLFESIPNEHGPDKLILNTNQTLEMLEQIPTNVVHEKLDDVLAAVKQLDSTCDYARCKAKTALMFQDICERDEFLHPTPLKTIRQEAELKKARERMEQKLKDMNLARKAKPASGDKKNAKKK